MRDWLLLIRNVVAALLVMAGFGAVLGSGLGFVWGAVAGGLAVAQRDSAYQRGQRRRAENRRLT